MILVTGTLGQIGTDLVAELRRRHGVQHVLATDLNSDFIANGAPYAILDVTDAEGLASLLDEYKVTTVYHLASLLSATGEKHPDLCWKVNVGGLRNVLAAATTRKIRVFWPSSIAVFGPHTPRFNTPQNTIEDPNTMYGITKVTGEMLCSYYAGHFGLDVRSLRFPGIISFSAPPGGGTTDYAVDIFHQALKHGSYTCFLRPETRLPMMYMPDAVRAVLEIMEAEASRISVRISYNLAAVSFSAEELVSEIRSILPDFSVTYEPDFRQAIADSWPAEIDDSEARRDWGWKHNFGTEDIVRDMLEHLRPVYKKSPI